VRLTTISITNNIGSFVTVIPPHEDDRAREDKLKDLVGVEPMAGEGSC
jgi:hypothetical protein